MNNRGSTEISDHEEVCLLLPWYVNGTLGDSQKDQVEEHIRSCIVCRRELSIEYRTLDLVRNESPLAQSVQAGFERLHSRITARSLHFSRQHPSRFAVMAWHRVLNTVRTLPGSRLRFALLVGPLTVMAIAFILTFFTQQIPVSGTDGIAGAATIPDAYHTLSDPVLGVAEPDDVEVIFSGDTSVETIEALLKSIPAKILNGPNSAGVYTVRLQDVSGEGERQAAILALRGRREVIFAEAAQPLAVSNEGGSRAR